MTERTMHDDADCGQDRTHEPTRSPAYSSPARRDTGHGDRRTYSLATLRRSLLEPRRMHARRREDRRHPVLDRFESGMLALAVALVGLSILDSLFTLMLLERGGSELNPIMNAVLGHGVWAFAGVKMALTAVPAVLLVATGNLTVFGLRARSVLAALVGGYAGLIVYELALLSLG